MKKLVFAALLAAAGCGKSGDPTATASTDAIATKPAAAKQDASPGGRRVTVTQRLPVGAADPDMQSKALGARIKCLSETGGLVLIGHRGGPTRDFPANALETLQRTYRAGTHGMEIDVTQSRDGKLYLMHDDTLDRATTGHGAPDSLSWTEVQKLNLRTGKKETGFHPASLDAVLEWAVANHALIELDRKAAASFSAMADAVHKAHAENNVLVVAYTDAQTLEVHKQAPDLTIVATIHSADQLDGLLKRGVAADRLVAWTGTEKPDPALWRALREKGVASAFGTLGPRGKSLDSDYWADGDGAEYQALAADGLRFLVTDLTDKVARELAAPLEKGHACSF